MFLDFKLRKWSIKSRQSQSEAMRTRYDPAPLVRQWSKGDTYPTQCQYPVRDPTKQELRAGGETWKCLSATQPKSSYCAHHHKICYVPVIHPTCPGCGTQAPLMLVSEDKRFTRSGLRNIEGGKPLCGACRTKMHTEMCSFRHPDKIY